MTLSESFQLRQLIATKYLVIVYVTYGMSEAAAERELSNVKLDIFKNTLFKYTC